MQVMEKKGLIRRTTNDADQRNKLCYLTSQGETLIPQLHSVLEYWEEACFEGIDKDALIQFQRVSVLITQNLMKQWNT
jgi:DNA-binding MarR family transcriptional regulator